MLSGLQKTIFSFLLVALALAYGSYEPTFVAHAQDVFKLFLGYWFGKVIAANGNGSGTGGSSGGKPAPS